MKRFPRTRSGRPASQHEDELGPFIDLLRSEGVSSYLEIGARHGDTFYEVMQALPVGSLGVAVDLPGGHWGRNDSVIALRSAVDSLREDGYSIKLFLGDSTDAHLVAKIRALGPFDAALIDGDHRYEGVKTDWQNYGPMARMVAFHDIVGEGQTTAKGTVPVEVPRLWREIKETGASHREFIGAETTMGIGVVWS